LAASQSIPNEEDEVKTFDAQRLPRTAVGLSLILAPLFLIASSLVCPGLESDEGAQLDVIAQHPSRWYWFTLLLLIGSMLLIPALLGIAALVREGVPRLGNLGGALAVLGSLISIGDVMSQFVSWQMVGNGADHEQMAALLKRFDEAAGIGIVFSVGGLAVLIGVVLLTVGLIRAHAAPAWAAIGLTVGTLLNIVTFSSASNGGVAVSWVVLFVAMSSIAKVLLAADGESRRSMQGAQVQTVPGSR
jgi:hypothetical protein